MNWRQRKFLFVGHKTCSEQERFRIHIYALGLALLNDIAFELTKYLQTYRKIKPLSKIMRLTRI
jgi:hypothetical protein